MHAFAECGRVSEEAPRSTFSWVAETQVARVETPSEYIHSLDFCHYTLAWGGTWASPGDEVCGKEQATKSVQNSLF